MREEFELRLSSILELIDIDGEAGFDDSKVEELEALIDECNELQRNDPLNQVADSIYDTLYAMLRKIKPNSHILSELWDEENSEEGFGEYTELLQKNPMMSILTIKSYDSADLAAWVNTLPQRTGYFGSYKINGHGVRVVYEYGNLVSATSRARSSSGRDLTRQMCIILGSHCEELEEYGMVELRGEVCLRLDRLETAREFNPAIKSAFSAVASLIRPSATEEEISLLDFLCYGFIVDDFSFIDREEEFQKIEECGFSVPQYLLLEDIDKDDLMDSIKSTIEAFEEGYEDFGYFCDGVVFEVNDRELFASLGTDGNHNCGNVALKVGLWKQDMYSGYVQKIIWTRGKSKLSPVAIVAEEPDMLYEDAFGEIQNWEQLGVLTAQGNTVTRVPLYEPKNIVILDAYPNELIHFRYGGESGVIPCFSDGRSLNEDVVVSILQGEDTPWDYIEDY